MNKNKSLDRRFQSIAWAALFILFGSLSLIPGDQNDVFVLGVGIILLAMNLARYRRQIPVSEVSTVLGLIASGLSLVVLLRPLLNIPRFELPLFPLLLIALGLGGLIRVARRPANE